MSAKKYNTMLAGGLVFILLGFVLLAASFTDAGAGMFLSYPTLLMLLGGVVLYFSFTTFKRAIPVFFGVMLLLCGFLILLVRLKILAFALYQLWPLFVIFSGIALIVAGWFRFKRMTAAYFVPAVGLFIMGGFFLLFSLHVIKTPFKFFAARWWPVLFVLAGIALVVLFLYTQNTNKAILESDEEFDDLL